MKFIVPTILIHGEFSLLSFHLYHSLTFMMNFMRYLPTLSSTHAVHMFHNSKEQNTGGKLQKLQERRKKNKFCVKMVQIELFDVQAQVRDTISHDKGKFWHKSPMKFFPFCPFSYGYIFSWFYSKNFKVCFIISFSSPVHLTWYYWNIEN